MKRALLLILLVCFFFGFDGVAQIANPQIINYNNDLYKAGIQNWDAAQDQNGIMYFGNNEGLLTFNGRFWNLIRLPNFTSVRSVEIDSKNRIFVGGQDEAGYFFPDNKGVLKYHSILPLIPDKYRKFADIWHMAILDDAVLFRSTNAIFIYKDNVVKVYPPATSWKFAAAVNGRFYAESRTKGLLVYENGTWEPYCDDPVFRKSAVTAILPYQGDTLLVSTLKSGLFLLYNGRLVPKHTVFDQIFLNDRIYRAGRTAEGNYIIGTTSAGVLIIDKWGELLQKYTYKDGLQNNNVRAFVTDKNQNLWLALDDGIDYIAINSAIKNIFPDQNKQITSYATRVFNNHLYVGTSNGLYATPVSPAVKDLSLSRGSFYEVPNSKGQVWSLDEINGRLLMGHEDGFFVVGENSARQIYSIPGTWLFEPVSGRKRSAAVIGGTYLGLQKIDYNGSDFSNGGQIRGHTESLRFITFDGKHTLWASHPYHGVYQIELSADFKTIKRYTVYTDKQGLPSHLYNYVFNIRNKITVATTEGIYEYDAGRNRFKVSALFNPAFRKVGLQYLKQDTRGNVWFVSNKRVGVFDFSKPTGKLPYTVQYFPQLDGKVVGGFENIYFMNNENVFIGANKGAYHINYTKYLQNSSRPEVLLGQVKLVGQKDSLIFGGYFLKGSAISKTQDPGNKVSIDYDFNSIHFEYSCTLFDQQSNTEFSYQLVGFDKVWSPWAQKSEKDYTNLPAGRYSFKVKARNRIDHESAVVTYSFEIEPAWYRSIWMYSLYVILIFIIISFFFKWQKKKHLAAQDRLSYLHQLELDRSEKEIVRLKYEKLEADVDYKNRELSTMTMHLVQRGKVLAKIKDVISLVIKNHDISDSSPSFRHLVRLIRDVEKSDQDWENFAMHFNTVNADFFGKLKEHFPELTPNELKLCAYLKMNLSSKEIAQLMNITIKAVEVGRYRLRKKLHLLPETNLYDFLLQAAKMDVHKT